MPQYSGLAAGAEKSTVSCARCVQENQVADIEEAVRIVGEGESGLSLGPRESARRDGIAQRPGGTTGTAVEDKCNWPFPSQISVREITDREDRCARDPRGIVHHCLTGLGAVSVRRAAQAQAAVGNSCLWGLSGVPDRAASGANAVSIAPVPPNTVRRLMSAGISGMPLDKVVQLVQESSTAHIIGVEHVTADIVAQRYAVCGEAVTAQQIFVGTDGCGGVEVAPTNEDPQVGYDVA